MKAIYSRRSIRKYLSKPVPKETIEKLIEAATLAPSGSNSQPWAFVVIQDQAILKDYSEKAKTLFIDFIKDKPETQNYLNILSNPNFNIFYNAGTLVIIYGNSNNPTSHGDCSMAAQNLMLAAHANDLGTCWIGFSFLLFNDSTFKKELGIPENYSAIAPLIIGYPDSIPSEYSRNPPQILVWK